MVCIPLFLHDDVMALFAITFSGGNGIVLFRLTLGLKAQKHLARAERQRRPELMCQIIFALQGQRRSGGLSVRRKVVIVLHFATPIKFQQTNYLTFGGLLSRNAGDFLRSVSVGVDFCEYLSV